MRKILVWSMIAALPMFQQPIAVAEPHAEIMPRWQSYLNQLSPVGARVSKHAADITDPQLLNDLPSFLYSQLVTGYLGLLHADAEYPDFWPFTNSVFSQLDPNPDTVYSMTPLEGSGVYKIVGYRGSVRVIDFQIGSDLFFTRGSGSFGPTLANYDIDTLHIGKNGYFEVLLSPTRPAGYEGDWWKLDPKATFVITRQIAYDWLHEVDGRFAIDRLDRPAIKPHPSAEQTDANMRQIPVWVETWANFGIDWVKRIRQQGGVNNFVVKNFSSTAGFSTQQYAQAYFEIAAGESLIIETDIPTQCRYWSFQLTDAFWRSIDWTNRQSSLSGFSGKLDKDGKFRAVVSAQDPGLPNWLDTGGFTQGAIMGRWENCNSHPTPTLTKVKLFDVRKHLPADTAAVSAEERDAAIRLRRTGAQLRKRW